MAAVLAAHGYRVVGPEAHCVRGSRTLVDYDHLLRLRLGLGLGRHRRLSTHRLTSLVLGLHLGCVTRLHLHLGRVTRLLLHLGRIAGLLHHLLGHGLLLAHERSALSGTLRVLDGFLGIHESFNSN